MEKTKGSEKCFKPKITNDQNITSSTMCSLTKVFSKIKINKLLRKLEFEATLFYIFMKIKPYWRTFLDVSQAS